jgi:hypothetical protein
MVTELSIPSARLLAGLFVMHWHCREAELACQVPCLTKVSVANSIQRQCYMEHCEENWKHTERTEPGPMRYFKRPGVQQYTEGSRLTSCRYFAVSFLRSHKQVHFPQKTGNLSTADVRLSNLAKCNTLISYCFVILFENVNWISITILFFVSTHRFARGSSLQFVLGLEFRYHSEILAFALPELFAEMRLQCPSETLSTLQVTEHDVCVKITWLNRSFCGLPSLYTDLYTLTIHYILNYKQQK